MPVTKVADIAYVRFQAPDLDQAEEFLVQFGMVRSERTPTALYMRGTDPAHHIHVTHLGAPKFLGLGFYADSEESLARLSKVSGASAVETIDEPGGGKRVRVVDPLGQTMEVVHAIRRLEPLPTRRAVMNWGDEKLRRKGELMRLAAGPSQVKRIAHAVMMAQGAGELTKWYREMFGFVSSDDVYVGTKDNVIMSFNRCDRGDEFVDHHTFLCVEGPQQGLHHVAFEVQNLDDVMLGKDRLTQCGKYRHVAGVGRHVLGGQIYDYWMDPWGRVHEHFTDTDVLNIRTPTNLIAAEEAMRSQWGAEVKPEQFV